jgi:hypothetical protein
VRLALLILCATLGTGCTCGKKKQPGPGTPELAPVTEADAAPADVGREKAEWRDVKKPEPPKPPAGTPDAGPRTAQVPVAPPDPLDVRSPKDPYYESLERHSLVTVGTAQALSGARDAAAVAAKIAEAHKTIGICHQKALEERPDLAGMLILDVTIDARGVISETAVVRNDLGDVAECATRRVRAVRFGSGEVGKLRVPMTFAAK